MQCQWYDVWKKKNDVDKPFKELNSHNENIKLTLEVNPTKFLDTELVRENRELLLVTSFK